MGEEADAQRVRIAYKPMLVGQEGAQVACVLQRVGDLDEAAYRWRQQRGRRMEKWIGTKKVASMTISFDFTCQAAKRLAGGWRAAGGRLARLRWRQVLQ